MSDHFITLQQAEEMTTRFRANKETILAPEERGKDILFNCESFERDAFDYLLGQSGAVGLRFYLGMSEDLQIRIVAVAYDAQGYDILPATGNTAKIAEEGVRCPPNCPPPPPPSSLLSGQ